MLVENVSQKATGVEGAYSDESGGDREVYDRPHRPARGSDAALRGLPAAVPEAAQRGVALLQDDFEWEFLLLDFGNNEAIEVFVHGRDKNFGASRYDLTFFRRQG